MLKTKAWAKGIYMCPFPLLQSGCSMGRSKDSPLKLYCTALSCTVYIHVTTLLHSTDSISAMNQHTTSGLFFNESALRLIQSRSRYVRLSVCLVVCPIAINC